MNNEQWNYLENEYTVIMKSHTGLKAIFPTFNIWLFLKFSHETGIDPIDGSQSDMKSFKKEISKYSIDIQKQILKGLKEFIRHIDSLDDEQAGKYLEKVVTVINSHYSDYLS